MTNRAFAAYMRHVTQFEHPGWLPEHDPSVEMHDDSIRIAQRHGRCGVLDEPLPRQLRALATMLQLCADELERRGFEEPK